MSVTTPVEQRASTLATGRNLNAVSYLMLMLPSQRNKLDVHNTRVLVTYLLPHNDIKAWGFVADEVSTPEAVWESLKGDEGRLHGRSWNDLLFTMMAETGLQVWGRGYVVDPAYQMVGLDVVGCVTRAAAGISWFAERGVAVAGIGSDAVLETMERAGREVAGGTQICLECVDRGFK